MPAKLKVLQVALAKQDFDLAAHTLVYGLAKAKADANEKKRSSKRQSKRPKARLL